MRVMDALSEISCGVGLTDTPIPISRAPEFVAEGFPAWATSLWPRGRYLNRLLDTPRRRCA